VGCAGIEPTTNGLKDKCSVFSYFKSMGYFWCVVKCVVFPLHTK
jgi:hypothetical protein